MKTMNDHTDLIEKQGNLIIEMGNMLKKERQKKATTFLTSFLFIVLLVLLVTFGYFAYTKSFQVDDDLKIDFPAIWEDIKGFFIRDKQFFPDADKQFATIKQIKTLEQAIKDITK